MEYSRALGLRGWMQKSARFRFRLQVHKLPLASAQSCALSRVKTDWPACFDQALAGCWMRDEAEMQRKLQRQALTTGLALGIHFGSGR